jgi:glycosyltransferase involved in cell wall biosynthesis
MPASKYVSHLQEICREVKIIKAPQHRGFDKPVEWLNYLLAGIPPDLRFYQSEKMLSTIYELASQVDFDVVQIEDLGMARCLEALPGSIRAKTVLTFHDVVFRKYTRIYKIQPKLVQKFRQWLHYMMMRRWEPSYAEKFNLCITMSEVDRSLLLSINPHLKIEVIPNGVDTKAYQVLPYDNSTASFIFVGDMDYAPNIDAVMFFAKEILPRIQKEILEVEMWVVGINPAATLKRIDGNVVHITGRVEDVRSYYQRSNICVIPLRAGGGTRLKILESMALGRPVVSTTIGCEGLDVSDGVNIFIADDPEEFAKKILLLLNNKELRQQIISNARKLVETHYDWDILADNYNQVIIQLDSG